MEYCQNKDKAILTKVLFSIILGVIKSGRATADDGAPLDRFAYQDELDATLMLCPKCDLNLAEMKDQDVSVLSTALETGDLWTVQQVVNNKWCDLQATDDIGRTVLFDCVRANKNVIKLIDLL